MLFLSSIVLLETWKCQGFFVTYISQPFECLKLVFMVNKSSEPLNLKYVVDWIGAVARDP